MSTESVFARPFHLEGNFAPVFEEQTLTNLRTSGSIRRS